MARTRTALPGFSVDEYAGLLRDAASAGYGLRPVESMPAWDGDRTVYLRHDVDIHIEGIERVAEVETDAGAASTYFVPLTLHFNPAYPPNRAVLRELVRLGHRIGLHYDLATYPQDEAAAWTRLEREVAALSDLVESPVESICMHNPGLGGRDVFAGGGRFVHPHAFGDVVYVSDSCRAWRDETLLELFGDAPPERLLLNTHPELWLGDADQPRGDFLEQTLLEGAVAPHVRYVREGVAGVWAVHPGPRLDDARQAR
jgi:hypothetical protein